MKNQKLKSFLLKFFSFSLTFFSLAFAVTWKNINYCLGDNILAKLGLKAWSNGRYGTHYTVLYSLFLLLIAFAIYVAGTEKKERNFKYFIIGSIIILLLINSLFFTI